MWLLSATFGDHTSCRETIGDLGSLSPATRLENVLSDSRVDHGAQAVYITSISILRMIKLFGNLLRRGNSTKTPWGRFRGAVAEIP
jgi:hypothetical protein